MKKAIELADTTFRAYKTGNGDIALHLRTYLMVYANADFLAKIRNARPSLNLYEPEKPAGLSAFMKEHPRCWLQLPGRKQRECELSYSCYPASRSIQRPSRPGWVTLETQDIADEESTIFYCSAKMTVRGDEDIFGDGNVSGLIIANMKMVFEINFPGHAPGQTIVMRRKVAVTRRGRGW